MKFYLTILGLVFFTTSLDIKAIAGSKKYEDIIRNGCDGRNHDIPCCPEYVKGNLKGKGKRITDFSPKTEAGCQNGCKMQYPTSIGVTQTRKGTSKCYCKFGSTEFPKIDGYENTYKTCLFSTTEQTAVTSIKLRDPAAVKAVAEGNAHFGLRLYEKVKEEDRSNLLMSPYSVSSVMAMLQVGARKETHEQIMKGMHFPEMTELLAGYSDVLRLTRGNKNFTLETANKLFVMEKFKMLVDFVREVKQYFKAQVTQTDFVEKGGQVSRNLMNDWVEENTNKKIKDLIPEGMLDSSTRMVLVNAIYFKGDWAIKFDSNKTREKDFYVNEDKTVKVKMMMNWESKFKMRYIQNLSSRVIELPYAGDRVSMYIILPADKFGLQEVEMNLTKMNLNVIFSKIDESIAEDVDLSLPKFKLEKTIKLTEILKKLGMNQMFSDMADFSGITETENLQVSDAIQKAFIEVNEEGSEAAAATAVHVYKISGGNNFVCNHPFIFFIRDKLTNMVLFNGRVVDPTMG